jgi:hypothetical protein
MRRAQPASLLESVENGFGGQSPFGGIDFTDGYKQGAGGTGSCEKIDFAEFSRFQF